MDKLEIHIDNAVPLADLYADAPDIFDRHIRLAANKSALLVEAEAKRRAPQVTRDLVRSIAGRTESLGGVTRGIVTVGAPYGWFAEYGRGPGKMPPHGPGSSLAIWARAIGLTGNAANPSRTDLSILFVIARAIGRHGTQAQPFLIPAFVDSKPKITNIFEQAVSDIVAEMDGR